MQFFGQLVDSAGVKPDPDKVWAIQEMREPTGTTDIRKFLGMANQMEKFTTELAEKAKLLRDLPSKHSQWMWGVQQQAAFDEIKQALSCSPTLAFYDPE